MALGRSSAAAATSPVLGRLQLPVGEITIPGGFFGVWQVATGVAVVLHKQRDDTPIIVAALNDGTNGTAGSDFKAFAKISGTLYEIVVRRANEASNSKQAGGFVELTGFPAGQYMVELWVENTSGQELKLQTFNVLSMLVWEGQ